MPDERTITLRINGREEEGRFPAHRTLLEALRHLGHMEVKSGCEKGDCGACAVLVDGMAVDSCLTLAWMAAGKEITTVSGLGDLDAPHPLQKAFADGGAAQCGYCIPASSSRPRRSSTSTGAERGRHSLGAERQSLPLHRLHQDFRGHCRRG